MLKTSILVLAVGVAGAAPLAHRPVFRPDGSVTVNGHVFATRADWLHSAEFRSSGARCGSDPVKSLAPVTSANDCMDGNTVINPAYDDGRTFVVQVVFHVIKKTDGTGDITPDLLKSQIDVLNEDYEALPNTLGAMGTNAKIKFVLARYDPMGNPTPGYEVVTNDSYYTDPGGGLSPMKSALHWDTSRYFNLYTNDCAGFLGYATFPWDFASSPDEDGVVLADYAVGRNSPNGGIYNLGRTLTHESGHWLGLLHTFQDGCVGTDATAYTTADDIKDTPRDDDSHFDCAPNTNDGTACPGQTAPIENYMEYTPDACMTKFTVEQSNRIRCSMVNYRSINTEPKAGFTFTALQLVVTFADTSTDAESMPAQMHYNWDFGDGTTSNDENPMHVYAAAGSYNVTLEVVDPGSAASTSTQSVVVVAGAPDAGMGGDDAGKSGGGCCSANGGDLSFVLSGAPIAFVLLRRRRGQALAAPSR